MDESGPHRRPGLRHVLIFRRHRFGAGMVRFLHLRPGLGPGVRAASSFPSYDPAVGTLASFATFAVGFPLSPGAPLWRIVSSVIFGDRWGRKPMLVATLLLVGGSTFLIGLLPTYSQVGIWAADHVVGAAAACRVSAPGAEYGGAVVMAVEFAPNGKTGSIRRVSRPWATQVGNALAGGCFSWL